MSNIQLFNIISLLYQWREAERLSENNGWLIQWLASLGYLWLAWPISDHYLIVRARLAGGVFNMAKHSAGWRLWRNVAGVMAASSAIMAMSMAYDW